MAGEPVPFEPDWTLSPGHMLREAMREKGLTEADMHGAGLLPETAAGILAGTVGVTEGAAARLASLIGNSASYWLNAERIYREDLARGARDMSEEWGQ